ncbi:MAG: RidA family protein [Firmicutes bacterium]|nr:RidA family protein [Bacillota bacterium]
MSIAKRLEELGIEIPPAVKPVAAYVPAVRVGDYVYTSGQLPAINGELPYIGKVDTDVTPEDAYKAARNCGINCLAAVSTVADIEDIEQIVKVTGFVASSPDFSGAPAVVNGASELFVEIFGDKGAHARSAIGVASLPLNVPVEVEMIVKLKSK